VTSEQALEPFPGGGRATPPDTTGHPRPPTPPPCGTDQRCTGHSTPIAHLSNALQHGASLREQSQKSPGRTPRPGGRFAPPGDGSSKRSNQVRKFLNQRRFLSQLLPPTASRVTAGTQQEHRADQRAGQLTAPANKSPPFEPQGGRRGIRSAETPRRATGPPGHGPRLKHSARHLLLQIRCHWKRPNTLPRAGTPP